MAQELKEEGNVSRILKEVVLNRRTYLASLSTW